jgi:hypothetical protein
MTPKSTKLSVHIENDRPFTNVKGEFTITDVLFSDLIHASGMDGKQIIKDAKQCIKTLKGFTPYEFICKQWTDEPERFRFNPFHQMPGPNT